MWRPIRVSGQSDSVVQVIEERTGEVVYTIRIRGREFSPKVFAKGAYTLRVEEGERLKALKGVVASDGKDERVIEVEL